MTPPLNKETFYDIRNNIAKFVRNKDEIAIGDRDKDHSDIAKELEVEETDTFGRPRVDDAGFISNRNGRFGISGTSSTCNRKPIKDVQRETTKNIVSRIIGD